MKFGMTSLILLLLLLLVTVASGIAILHIYKNNYKTYNLLRVDPLETGSLKAANLEATLSHSDIWMLGDSRMKRWNEALLNDTIEIANLGIEAQTSSQVYHRFKIYLETATPSVVIIEVGINELKIIGLDKNLTASITDQYFRNIESFIQICRNKNIRMVLINIFPVGKIEISRRIVWNKAVNETIINANHRLKSYCDDNQVYYFDAYSILSDNGETVNAEYQSDFMHINNSGYEALSRELKKMINKIMKQ